MYFDIIVALGEAGNIKEKHVFQPQTSASLMSRYERRDRRVTLARKEFVRRDKTELRRMCHVSHNQTKPNKKQINEKHGPLNNVTFEKLKIVFECIALGDISNTLLSMKCLKAYTAKYRYTLSLDLNKIIEKRKGHFKDKSKTVK